VIDLDAILGNYDLEKLTIATLASHTALQIMHGAKAEGFRTTLVVLSDRLWFYEHFAHLVDEFIVISSWSDVCSEHVISRLRSLNAVLVPHGSFVEYVGLNCAEKIPVPIFGLRALFRVEADQKLKMDLLRRAGIPTPRTYSLGDHIDRPVIVKLPGAKGGRGYFISSNAEEVERRLEEYVERSIISSIDEALIQEYLIGVTAYFHYFYSPVLGRLEITGMDIRYESDVDALRRLPPRLTQALVIDPTFTVVGNIPMVLRESLLPKVLEYGLKFVDATRRSLPPGVVGPFCLESVIDRDLNIVVFEFSGRIVAGTNLYIDGSPYSYLYWNEPMSVGRRIAREIKIAVEKGMLKAVLT